MTFEDTVFEPATPKGAKPAKKKLNELTEEQQATLAAGAPIKQRRKRGPNKVKTGRAGLGDYDDLRQILVLFRGLSKAKRTIVMNMLAIMFD